MLNSSASWRAVFRNSKGSVYWIELLMEAGIVQESSLKELTDEADELMAIFTTCVKKVKAR